MSSEVVKVDNKFNLKLVLDNFLDDFYLTFFCRSILVPNSEKD